MTAVVARRPPWYRRLFGRQRAMAAGERPRHLGRDQSRRRSGLLRRLVVLVFLLAVLGAVAGYLFVPQVRDRVDGAVADIRRAFATFSNPGRQAVDSDVSTYWLANPDGDPPSVTINFAETLNLIEVTFHSGASTGPDFTLYRRPRTVEFHAPGQTRPQVIVLRDEAAAQSHELELAGVRTLELRIVDFYPEREGGEPLVALREVEFTSRR